MNGDDDVADWWIYRGVDAPHAGIRRLPDPPPWRAFDGGPPITPAHRADSAATRRLGDIRRAETYRPRQAELDLVNAALFLRRPLLVTGKPGTGKSTLPYAVAHELGLGPVLRWPITSRSTLQQGLYDYDAIARLREATLSTNRGDSNNDDDDIGQYINLGPLGTALLPYDQPRVLLIDEIDKSDIDLPNDLLNTFEEGEFAIPELRRIAASRAQVLVRTADNDWADVRAGQVRCRAFPFIVLTSNGEREFPSAFLRRCLRLDLGEPTHQQLATIVEAHLGSDVQRASMDLIDTFVSRRQIGTLATDQLLNAIYLTSNTGAADRDQLADVILRHMETEVDAE